MSTHLDIFTRKDVIVVFTYAPAGLGHLRVTDALYEGLPAHAHPLLVGSDDEFIKRIHRLSSVSVPLRGVMEWIQQGRPQTVFTRFYRRQLKRHNRNLYRRFIQILEHQIELPQVMLIVASHFGLAYQLGSFKHRLEKKFGIKIIVEVIVTDDSPQHIWYVPGADRIFVPSHVTKRELIKYGKEASLPAVKFEVISYPISPKLAVELSREDWQKRQVQLSPQSRAKIHVVIPISGAAVGMDYFTDLVTQLKHLSRRFHFHIVSRQSLHTNNFLQQMSRKQRVNVYASTHDREVVDKYQEIYTQQPVALEITKPSEQAFKVLYSTKHIGGVVLLFCRPVGRQEYDNLAFMRRHQLLPSQESNDYLWDLAAKSLNLVDQEESAALWLQARHWRGIMIPHQAKTAAKFIRWLHEQGLLSQMGQAQAVPNPSDEATDELSPHGVHKFWQITADLVSQSIK